ncbi:MAG: hypothetical protein R2855_09895 [Thermomicrobiales bacterium]
MGILEEQLIGDRIPLCCREGYLRPSTSRNLEDVVNDVGFIVLPSGDVRAVALLSLGVPDDDRATEVEQRLALIAAGVFDLPAFDDGRGAR